MNNGKVIYLTSNTSWYLYNFRKSTIVELIDNGFCPVCIAPRDCYTKKLIELGAEFIEINLEGKSANPIKEITVILKILVSLIKNRPSFVFNFTIKMNIYFGLCCSILKIPFSNNVSGLGTAFIHESILYSVVRKLYGFVNLLSKCVFFQNKDDLKLFCNKKLTNIEKSILLPGSGIDVNDFLYKPVEKNRKNIKFIMIARVIADKGVKEYIDAANIVSSHYPNACFSLVGDWKVSNKSSFDENKIKYWIENGIVKFEGHQENVKEWIYNSDIIVLPSYREGMPRTILEGASCGRASIVTDVPGCRHAIIPDVTGWLCEVKSSESLAATMLVCAKLTRDELDQYGKSARAYMESEFSDKIVIGEYLKVLNKYT